MFSRSDPNFEMNCLNLVNSNDLAQNCVIANALNFILLNFECSQVLNV